MGDVVDWAEGAGANGLFDPLQATADKADRTTAIPAISGRNVRRAGAVAK
jgi:hypothetical protein